MIKMHTLIFICHNQGCNATEHAAIMELPDNRVLLMCYECGNRVIGKLPQEETKKGDIL